MPAAGTHERIEHEGALTIPLPIPGNAQTAGFDDQGAWVMARQGREQQVETIGPFAQPRPEMLAKLRVEWLIMVERRDTNKSGIAMLLRAAGDVAGARLFVEPLERRRPRDLPRHSPASIGSVEQTIKEPLPLTRACELVQEGDQPGILRVRRS